MRKYLWLSLFLIFVFMPFIQADVLKKQVLFNDVISELPSFSDVSCKFSQEKYLKNSGVSLLSGGNFYFKKSSGITFETLYPINSIVSYTKNSNRQIGKIIDAISNKNYSFIDKNFKVYFEKKSNLWILVLVPQNNMHASEVLDYIEISGNNTIDSIIVKSLNGDKTKLQFVCPRG